MIEYLVMATAVILAILAVRVGIQGRVTNLGNAARDQIDSAAGTVTAEVTPTRR